MLENTQQLPRKAFDGRLSGIFSCFGLFRRAPEPVVVDQGDFMRRLEEVLEIESPLAGYSSVAKVIPTIQSEDVNQRFTPESATSAFMDSDPLNEDERPLGIPLQLSVKEEPEWQRVVEAVRSRTDFTAEVLAADETVANAELASLPPRKAKAATRQRSSKIMGRQPGTRRRAAL
jgi:hypothetical protein